MLERRVSAPATPDPTQFKKKSEYYDPKAKPEKPIWFAVELEFVEQLPELLPLPQLRSDPELKDMVLLQRGSRLSIQPVKDAEFKHIVELAKS